MDLSKKKHLTGAAGAGLSAGAVNGLFGGGGGMLLIPGLRALAGMNEEALFPASVSVMLPVSALTLWLSAQDAPLPWSAAWPYLAGSAAGGVLAGIFSKRVKVLWLHRALGLMLLWGGVRYLW